MVALEHRPNAVSDQGSSVLTACSACPGMKLGENWEENTGVLAWNSSETS